VLSTAIDGDATTIEELTTKMFGHQRGAVHHKGGRERGALNGIESWTALRN
jgi:hypothetical protein